MEGGVSKTPQKAITMVGSKLMYINNKLCQIARDDRKREEDAKEAVGKSKGKKAAGGKTLIFIKLFFI